MADIPSNLRLGMGSPWPLPDVLAKLIEATEHLLHGHDCDADGWEEYQTAVKRGKEYLVTLRAQVETPADVNIARPLSEYHEDHGNVVWWKFPINEPSWIGTPSDDSWPGYHTHWTPHPPRPFAPKTSSPRREPKYPECGCTKCGCGQGYL